MPEFTHMRTFTLFVATVLVTSQVLAQVNVEPVRQQLQERGSTVIFQGSINATEGNTRAIQLGGGGLLGLSDSANLSYVTGSGDYARYDGTDAVHRAFLHARYNRTLAQRIWGELFGQLGMDRFRFMTARRLLGVGPRFQLLGGDVSIYYGVSYMLESTQRSDEVAASRRRELNHRCNNYATLIYQPHENIVFSETIYYQPRFDLPRDFWMLSEFGARFKSTDLLSSSVNFSVHHEAEAPPELKRTDYSLTTSLAVMF